MAGAVDPRLLKRARATRPFLVAGVAVGSLTAILVICQAWVLSRLVARVFDSGTTDGLPFGGLWPALGVLALIIAGRAALAWFSSWLAHWSAAAVKSQLRADIMDARLRQPGRTHATTGSLIALLTHGLDALDGYFARYLPQLVLALTVPLIVGITILTTDLASAIIIALALPLIPVFMILIGLATKARMAKSWRVYNRLSNHFGDLVTGLPTLQAFGRAKSQVTGLKIAEDTYRSETMSTLRVTFLSSFVLELLATYSVALVAVPIGLQLVYDRMDLTTGLFVLILVPEVFLPVRQVGVHYHDSLDGIAAADQAFAVIEAADRPAAKPRSPIDPAAKPRSPIDPAAKPRNPMGADGQTGLPDDRTITFDDVEFRHPDAALPSLTGFSAEIGPGEVVAISGPSGSGKSTALGLLMGFWTPSSGQIRVGNVPLDELDPEAWRSQLAWVGQEPGLITGTIADNVRLGDPDASIDRVRDALHRAGGQSLEPERELGDAGENLSAGEIRRIAVARALLRIESGARLLVLDEPTAGLDADTEARVIESVRRSGAGAVVVTHRAAVRAAADRIIGLEASVR